MPIFASHELTVAHEFLEVETQLATTLGDDDGLPSLRPVLDGLGSVTLLFGLCELNDKRVVRRAAAGQKASLGAGYGESRDSYNREGLKALKGLLALSAKLEGEMASQRGAVSAARIKQVMRDARARIHLYLADADIKQSDIVKVSKAFGEVEAAFLKDERAVGQLLTAKLTELETLRNSADRGNRDNIPPWKLVIIAAYVVVSLTYVTRCILQNRCSRNEKAYFYMVAALMGISLKFC